MGAAYGVVSSLGQGGHFLLGLCLAIAFLIAWGWLTGVRSK